MPGRDKKKWRDLTSTQQRAIALGAAAEVVLTSFAVRDLVRRSGAEVRGPKPLWLLAFVVQPFGPLAYLFLGRHRGS